MKCNRFSGSLAREGVIVWGGVACGLWLWPRWKSVSRRVSAIRRIGRASLYMNTLIRNRGLLGGPPQNLLCSHERAVNSYTVTVASQLNPSIASRAFRCSFPGDLREGFEAPCRSLGSTMAPMCVSLGHICDPFASRKGHQKV